MTIIISSIHERDVEVIATSSDWIHEAQRLSGHAVASCALAGRFLGGLPAHRLFAVAATMPDAATGALLALMMGARAVQ